MAELKVLGEHEIARGRHPSTSGPSWFTEDGSMSRQISASANHCMDDLYRLPGHYIDHRT